jgi:type II secretory ATPase GspE/PulE/Tfp pilus assembly ATPase PilB-like protein/DNA-binding NarL/FixJ family response regulator
MEALRPRQYSLLLVDDEPNVLKALQRIFREENYRIHTASDGEEALAVLQREPCQLLISDFKMPSMNGVELIRKVRKHYPEVIRIMLTGQADTEAVMGAIKDGAVYKFILKPWNDDDLRITVALALEQYDLLQRNKALQQSNQRKNRELNTLSKLAVTNRSQLTIMLNKRGLLNQQQVQALYKLQQSSKEPVLKQILERDWLKEETIRDILRKDLMIEEVALAEFQVDAAIAALLPRAFCEHQWLLPLKQQGQRMLLVMADPMDSGLITDLSFAIGMDIEAVMADSTTILDKIVEVYGEQEVDFEDFQTLVSISDPYEGIEIIIDDEEEQISLEELLRGTDEPPAIRLVNAIILEALRLGSSDIHIQPRTRSVVVRYRIDGILSDKIQIPLHFQLPLVSRIKVMAELDITERRKPQDGRITVKTPLRVVDLRISTLPTMNGETVVMRILDRNASVHNMDELGLAEIDRQRLHRVISLPQGMILATGPTGSGKTTTLYSLLRHNATAEKNYVTLEDPVEYHLDMARQVMIREKIGLDFATVLRSVLRQDPDVILLGEIRDTETAEVALQAALTGHLVYSTLHTNSAAASIARLFDLGLKPYIVATALEAIIAQRLVRCLCEHCRKAAEPTAEIRTMLAPLFADNTLPSYHSAGCEHCHHTGYLGRTALYEVLIPNETLRQLIASGATTLEIAAVARQQGMTSLIDDARGKIATGVTSPAEILRVLGAQAQV